MTLFYVYGTRRRTGIAVSRKIQKAVERNRAKRRFREILRREGDGLDICTEQVWLLEPNLINAPLHRIRSDFNEILGKII